MRTAACSPVRRERLSPHTRITNRQLEVLRLLGEGRTNLQISVRLGFSDIGHHAGTGSGRETRTSHAGAACPPPLQRQHVSYTPTPS